MNLNINSFNIERSSYQDKLIDFIKNKINLINKNDITFNNKHEMLKNKKQISNIINKEKLNSFILIFKINENNITIDYNNSDILLLGKDKIIKNNKLIIYDMFNDFYYKRTLLDVLFTGIDSRFDTIQNIHYFNGLGYFHLNIKSDKDDFNGVKKHINLSNNPQLKTLLKILYNCGDYSDDFIKYKKQSKKRFKAIIKNKLFAIKDSSNNFDIKIIGNISHIINDDKLKSKYSKSIVTDT